MLETWRKPLFLFGIMTLIGSGIGAAGFFHSKKKKQACAALHKGVCEEILDLGQSMEKGRQKLQDFAQGHVTGVKNRLAYSRVLKSIEGLGQDQLREEEDRAKMLNVLTQQHQLEVLSRMDFLGVIAAVEAIGHDLTEARKGLEGILTNVVMTHQKEAAARGVMIGVVAAINARGAAKAAAREELEQTLARRPSQDVIEINNYTRDWTLCTQNHNRFSLTIKREINLNIPHNWKFVPVRCPEPMTI